MNIDNLWKFKSMFQILLQFVLITNEVERTQEQVNLRFSKFHYLTRLHSYEVAK